MGGWSVLIHLLGGGGGCRGDIQVYEEEEACHVGGGGSSWRGWP